MLKIIILAFITLTGCVNLSPTDINRLLDRLDKELDAYHATPLPENVRPAPRLPTGRTARAQAASPAPMPSESAKPE